MSLLAAIVLHALGAALSLLAPSAQRFAWYKIYGHSLSTFVAVSLGRAAGTTSRSGFLVEDVCVAEADPPDGSAMLLCFELCYCVVDVVALVLRPAPGRLDMFLHHAATVSLIISGQAHRFWGLGLHFLAVAGPATILLCARDVGLSFKRPLTRNAFAACFLWARVVLVPAAFVSKLILCDSWPASAVLPQAVLVTLGLKWTLQLCFHRARQGEALAAKLRCTTASAEASEG